MLQRGRGRGKKKPGICCRAECARGGGQSVRGLADAGQVERQRIWLPQSGPHHRLGLVAQLGAR